MTHEQAIRAYTTIISMGRRAKGKAAFALFHLKGRLKEVIDFQAEKEMELIKKYDGELRDGGLVFIEDKEKRKQFLEEKNEIGKMEIEPEITPVRINPELIPDINIEEIEALSGFVNFE